MTCTTAAATLVVRGTGGTSRMVTATSRKHDRENQLATSPPHFNCRRAKIYQSRVLIQHHRRIPPASHRCRQEPSIFTLNRTNNPAGNTRAG